MDNLNLILYCFLSFSGVTLCTDLFTCDGLIYGGRCYRVEKKLLDFDTHSCHITSIQNATINNLIVDELLKPLSNIPKVYINADTEVLTFSDWTNWRIIHTSGSSSKRRKRRSSGIQRFCGYLDVQNSDYFWVKGSCGRGRYALCDREYYTWNAWGAWGRCSLETERRTRNRSCIEEGCNHWLQENGLLDRCTENENCNPYDEWSEWSQWGDCELLTESHNRSRHCMGEICRVENSRKGGVNEIQNEPCDPYGNWTEWTRWGVCPVTEVRKRWRFCVGSKHCREEKGIGRMMNETCIPERAGVLHALPGRLLNYTHVIEGVDSLVSCAVHCKVHPSTCTSVNYEPNLLLCELNNKEGKIYPSDLVKTADMDWVNFEFMVVEEEEDPFNITSISE